MAMKKTTKQKKTPAKKSPEYAGPVLVLKTTKAGGVPHYLGQGDGKGGKIATPFVWPRSGCVVCPDWNPEPKCGGGFHGLEFGEGSWGLLNEEGTPREEWRVIRVEQSNLVRLNDNDSVKVKFRTGEIVYCGDKAGALALVMCGKESMERAVQLSKDQQSGDYSSAASSGDYSSAASSGYYSSAASSGDSSRAASSGDYSSAEQIGKSGIAAAIGGNVRAKAGPNGLLILTYWDAREERYHACVGEVGRDVEADTWYKVVDGKLAKE